MKEVICHLRSTFEFKTSPLACSDGTSVWALFGKPTNVIRAAEFDLNGARDRCAGRADHSLLQIHMLNRHRRPSRPRSDISGAGAHKPVPSIRQARLIKMGVEVTFSTSQSAINHIAKTKTDTTIPQGLTLSPFFDGNENSLQPGVNIKHYISEVKNHGSQHIYS
ncbi:hypothetical protein LguiA_002181 [Lonicera macranthoides]